MREASRLRVLVALDVAPERNGVATYWRDLAGLLADTDTRVALLSAAPEARPPEFLSLSPLFQVPLLGDPTQGIAFPTPRAVREAVRAFDPMVVVIATPGPVGLLALRAARASGIPVVACLHTNLTGVVSRVLSRGIARAATWPLERLESYVVRRAALLAAPGAQHATEVAARFGVAVREVATPVAPEFAEAAVVTAPRPPRRVLYMGRLSAEKNVSAVIHAARAHADLTFDLVGAGPAETALRAGAPPNVRFHGWLGRRALREQVDRSDLVVMPSLLESFGTAALEGMARARPTIVSPRTGVAGIIQDDVNGLVCGAGETLAERLTRARALAPGALAAIGASGRRTALQHSAWCVAQWCALLTAVVGGAAV